MVRHRQVVAGGEGQDLVAPLVSDEGVGGHAVQRGGGDARQARPVLRPRGASADEERRARRRRRRPWGGMGSKTDFLHERALLQAPRIVTHAIFKGISVGDTCKQ